VYFRNLSASDYEAVSDLKFLDELIDLVKLSGKCEKEIMESPNNLFFMEIVIMNKLTDKVDLLFLLN
jgi:hypothetical protein